MHDILGKVVERVKTELRYLVKDDLIFFRHLLDLCVVFGKILRNIC